MKVLVGVCTCGRPNGLARLLAELANTRVPAGVSVEVLVVDDDPGRSAHGVVDSASGFDGGVAYRSLGSRNIARARNEVLAASADVDLVVFIDDDEWPDPDWLVALLSCRERHDCDVVIGPVLGELPPGAPKWMTEQFAIISGRDGDRLHEGITGNAMVSRDLLKRTGVSFAEDLGGSGGEDQLFFRRLARSGADIRYAAHAVVHEVVPPERTTLRYVLRRSFRTGNTLGLLDTHVLATPRSRGERTAKAAVVTVRGALTLFLTTPLCAVRRARDLPMRALLELARGLGMLVGISGFRLDFYHRPARLRRWHHPPGGVR